MFEEIAMRRLVLGSDGTDEDFVAVAQANRLFEFAGIGTNGQASCPGLLRRLDEDARV